MVDGDDQTTSAANTLEDNTACGGTPARDAKAEARTWIETNLPTRYKAQRSHAPWSKSANTETPIADIASTKYPKPVRESHLRNVTTTSSGSCATEQRILLLHGAALGAGPDRQAERDLVHEVSEVVHQVQGVVVHLAQHVAEEIPERVDRPANGHDETHGVERCLHVPVDLVVIASGLTSLTREDLVQDETPPAHAEEEAATGRDEVGLAAVTRRQHHDGADEQPPEHTRADVGLHRLQDQVELNHLKGHGDGPVNVTVEDGGAVDDDPVLAHVEVVHRSHQGHQ